MSRPPQRPIKRLLVCNRGEIATRIISAARELDLETWVVYTTNDVSHVNNAAHTIEIPSAASYLDIDRFIDLVRRNGIDAVHPGYGFLSESPEFARRMWEEAGAVVVGPGWEILEQTGDKLKARTLAEQCGVSVAPALPTPTNDIADICAFAQRNGLPIMIKAVDGGGGRGIRLIRSESQLEDAAKRAIEESPSRQVFAEKASIDGFRHVEVQIVGDGKGHVRHLWERECSIQRRYQKIVEIAPSTVSNRGLVEKVIEAATRMAERIHYFSLGTFEFLLNPTTEECYFLEVNPRLQVEHTITESICMLDIVKIQLLLAQGASLAEAGLPEPLPQPQLHSIQLRITAENVQSDWSLSIGKIQSFQFPSGNGIRVDTHLINGQAITVSADFDSLLAKIIVTATTWDDTIQKARRALEDTRITGVKTNLDVLRAIIPHPDFAAGKCDTQWLEANQKTLVDTGEQIPNALASRQKQTLAFSPGAPSGPTTSVTNSTLLFRKGDAWSIALAPHGRANSADAGPTTHHLELTRVLRNDFPSSLSAEILYASTSSEPTPYTLHLAATSASASATLSTHRRGNPTDPSHICIPFPGKLVEVLVDEGDEVRQGDVVCVVRQMKMELEVRAARSGRVKWVTEAEEGEEVAEWTLAAELELEDGTEKVKARL